MEWISVEDRLPNDDKSEDDRFVADEWFVIRATPRDCTKESTVESYFCGWYGGWLGEVGWTVATDRPVTTQAKSGQFVPWLLMLPLNENIWRVTHWMRLKELPRPEKGTA